MIQAPKLGEPADEPLRSDRLRVERDRSAAAEQASRRPPCGIHPSSAAAGNAPWASRWALREVFSEWRRSGREGLLPFGLPAPGEEFVQPGLRFLGDAGEDVGELGLGVDVVELGGADEMP